MSTTAEEMAIAVLRGDTVAARALADELCTQTSQTDRPLPPVTKVTCDWSRLRVVVYLKNEVCREGELADDFQQQMERAILGWLRGRDPESAEVLVLAMIDRLELYELPAGFGDPEDAPAPPRMVPNEPPVFDLGGGPPSALARLGAALGREHAARVERAVLGLPPAATDAEVAAEIERFRTGDQISHTILVPLDAIDRRLLTRADPGGEPPLTGMAFLDEVP